MKKEYLIKIKGEQTVGQEVDMVELTTVGSFFKRNNCYYITYLESEATGFDGAKTVLRVDTRKGVVTMKRMGSSNSQLIIEEGRRHQCNYDTGYGNLIIGVSGNKIVSSLTDSGGDVTFAYSLDINTMLTSENKVHISVCQ